MNLSRLTLEQIDTIIARHTARDVSFFSPSFPRHAGVRWTLENQRLKHLNGEAYGKHKSR